MLIKICGLRDPENIRKVIDLGVDLIGFVFCKESPRFVSLVNSRAGIIPDRLDSKTRESVTSDVVRRVGVFADEMPQTIVTNVYNFSLDYVQLDGDESPICIDNLRRSIVPDIRPELKIIKTIAVDTVADIAKTAEYEGHADMLMFRFNAMNKDLSGSNHDFDILQEYRGHTPFLLSGDIGPTDVERVRAFRHPRFVGIDLDTPFEAAPAVKDISMLKAFVEEMRR